LQKDEKDTQEKIDNIREIIKIVGDNMENQIEIFKSEKTQNYYKYLKMFAIMQRESNRVIRELWNLVKDALNEINPNLGNEDNYQQQEEQNENHEDYEKEEQQEQNEIHEEKVENQEPNEQYEEQPPQEGEEGGNAEE